MNTKKYLVSVASSGINILDDNDLELQLSRKLIYTQNINIILILSSKTIENYNDLSR